MHISKNDLFNEIIEVLAKHPGRTIDELYKLLEGNNQPTKPTLYRTIAGMIEEQTLMKQGKKISLHAVWIETLRDLLGTIEKNIANKKDILLPTQEMQVIEYEAETLSKLDPTWSHLILQMTKEHKSEKLYIYNSHAWYMVGMSETERRLFDAFGDREVQMVYGGKTNLDLYGKELIEMFYPNINITIRPDTGFPKEGYNLWICGNMIISVTFPTHVGELSTYYFEKIQNIEDLNMKAFQKIFHIREKIKLRITKDPKQAEQLKKRFASNN